MIDTQAIRSKILDLAMRGQLTEQLPEDGIAEELYQKIQFEKQLQIEKGTIKKGKPLPDINDEEVPYEIPTSWLWVRVGAVAEIAGGTTPNSSEISEKGMIPYFKVSDMNTPGNETRMIHASNFVSENYNGKIFPAGTTIFPKNGGAALTNKRRILTVPSAVDLNTGGCTPIIPTMVGWIRLFMETVDFGKMDTGSNIPTVNATNLKKRIVALPPLAEQQRIVEKIDQAFSVLDTIDTLQAQYADNLTALKAKLIAAAIQGKLTEQLPEDGTAEELYQQIQTEKQALIKAGKIKKEKPLSKIKEEEIPFEIPGNWKWVRISEIAYLTSGNQYEEVEDGLPYVKVADMNLPENQREIVTSSRFVSKENIGKIPLSSIIFPKRGGAILTNKKRLVVKSPIFIDSNTMAMTMIEPNILLYIRHWFESINLGDLHTGTAIPQVNNKDIYPMIVPLPPLSEQIRIVEKLDELLAAI